MTRVLIVEDNEALARGLRNNLEYEGYDVVVAADAPSGIAAAREHAPDLIILDLMLPGMDGYRALRQLRESGDATPVLVLTALADEADKVRGFRFGADDYVTKPFGLMELLARIDALLRRAGARAPGATPPSPAPSSPAPSAPPSAAPAAGAGSPDSADHPPPDESPPDEPARRRLAAVFGDVALDADAHVVTRSGRPVALRPREYDLLLALLERAGAVVTRDALLRQVWGYERGVTSRTVDTHMAELRRKLEPDPAHPRHLLTVRKSGYRLAR